MTSAPPTPSTTNGPLTLPAGGRGSVSGPFPHHTSGSGTRPGGSGSALGSHRWITNL